MKKFNIIIYFYDYFDRRNIKTVIEQTITATDILHVERYAKSITGLMTRNVCDELLDERCYYSYEINE